MHPDLPEQMLAYAMQAMRAGKLAGADLALRDLLDIQPGNAPALNLLGVVAAQVGAREHAIACFEKALALEPDHVNVRENLRAACALQPPVMPPGDRYLLIRAWGFGFWADVSQLLGSLLLAEATGRIPVTYWGAESRFSDRRGGDAWRHFFEPVSSASLQTLAQIPNATFFPPRWHSGNLTSATSAKWEGKGSRAGAVYFLNRPETVAVSDFLIGVAEVAPWLPSSHPLHGKPTAEIYRTLIDRYLKPRADILAECDAFLARHVKGKPFLALHMRGSDKAIEDPNLEQTQAALAAAADAVDPSWPILLLTDDAGCLARMRERYGARLLTTECQRTGTEEGVHYLEGIDPVCAGREVLTDACLALRATRFIGNGRSNVSAMIAFMKDWAPDSCTLIGGSLLLERNLHVHRLEILAPAITGGS